MSVLAISVFSGDVSVYVDLVCFCFFFQAEDGIRDLVRSRGLGDVYKRQLPAYCIIILNIFFGTINI